MTWSRKTLWVAGVTVVVGGACGSSNSSPAQGGGGGRGGGTSSSDQTATGSSSGGSPSTSSSGGTAGSDAGTPGSGLWVMGYFPSWSAGTYGVDRIDWDGLTHVAAAFYLPDGTTAGWKAGGFDTATANALIAAAHAHGKKVIASIGGASSGTEFEGACSAQNLPKFLTNLKALITQGYDGIDIDWENDNGSMEPTDQPLEAALVQGLRQQNPHTILTFTAGSQNENLVDAHLAWYATITPYVDQINLMTYHMSGAYSGWQSWHSSPLHWNHVASTPSGIDATVSHYLSAGVPAAKLGVGIGFYGMCYTAPVTAPAQALSGSTEPTTSNDDTMSYANIMASYYSSAAYHYDATANVPYLTLDGSNPQKCTYVSYEDARSIADKAAWVKAQGLGGTIIWDLTEGYVSSGATVQAQNPLLEATKTSFLK